MAQEPLVFHCLQIIGTSRLHSDTPLSIGLF